MAANAHQDDLIPVSIVTGFLGSGKTTLLSSFGRSAYAQRGRDHQRFGEMPLDHLLVTKPKEDVMPLSSGCICCTSR